MIAILVAVSLFLLASSSAPALEPYSISLRVVGALVVIVPVVWRKRLPERASFPRFSRAVIVIGIGFVLYLIASAYVHNNTQAFVLGVISFLLVVCLIYVLLYYYSTPKIVGGVYTAFLLICVTSLAAYRLLPDIAIENFRLRGVIENANGLGYVAFALGAVSLAACIRVWQSLLGLVVALACLLLSGSRASMLAFVVVALLLAIGGIRRARVGVVVGVIAATVAWLMGPGVWANVLLFRTTDTRSVGFETMQRAMNESFWTGLGKLPTATRVAGSPFAAGITGGMWGLVGLGLIYVGLIRNIAPSGPRTRALVVAGIVHSMFEGWMLSFSAPMLLAFFILLVGFVKLDTAETERAVDGLIAEQDHVMSTESRNS